MAITDSGRQVLGQTDQDGRAVLDLDAILLTVAAAGAPARVQADLGDEAMSLYVDVETTDGFAKKVTVSRIGGKSVALDAGQFPALAALNRAKQDEIDNAAQRAEEELLAALRREEEAREARETRAKEIAAACDDIEFTAFIEPTAEGAMLEQMLKEAEQDAEFNEHALVRLCRRKLSTQKGQADTLLNEIGLVAACSAADDVSGRFGMYAADCLGFSIELSLVEKPELKLTKEMKPTFAWLRECQAGGDLLVRKAKRLKKKAKKQRRYLKSKSEKKKAKAVLYTESAEAADQCLANIETYGPGVDDQFAEFEAMLRQAQRRKAAPPASSLPSFGGSLGSFGSSSSGRDSRARDEARRAREEAERARSDARRTREEIEKQRREDEQRRRRDKREREQEQQRREREEAQRRQNERYQCKQRCSSTSRTCDNRYHQDNSSCARRCSDIKDWSSRNDCNNQCGRDQHQCTSRCFQDKVSCETSC